MLKDPIESPLTQKDLKLISRAWGSGKPASANLEEKTKSFLANPIKYGVDNWMQNFGALLDVSFGKNCPEVAEQRMRMLHASEDASVAISQGLVYITRLAYQPTYPQDEVEMVRARCGFLCRLATQLPSEAKTATMRENIQLAADFIKTRTITLIVNSDGTPALSRSGTN